MTSFRGNLPYTEQVLGSARLWKSDLKFVKSKTFYKQLAATTILILGEGCWGVRLNVFKQGEGRKGRDDPSPFDKVWLKWRLTFMFCTLELFVVFYQAASGALNPLP